ncbi:hypothetical protein [Chromobacterium sp. IIBBL 290-4]|uniref:hypothetical protein n=1 Tax=Chromobacterium sp. IIBBL 290-4 TaxID=2953890 RepID=UPI0020B7E00B|nr:hypothetical protein [Chromobacterium sp. IIBBL 290-4]UTH73496.1 hypothetical protein NKT35_18430 [Chromobacterium sp. IIBBL 290-4]
MMSDINKQPFFTQLDSIQDKHIQICRDLTASNLEVFLTALRPIRLEFSNCLNEIWNRYELMIRKEPGHSHLVLSGSGDILPDIKEREKFEAVLASYTSGVRSVENVIFEGAYVQACALIRQELEALTQMRNLIQDTAKDKTAPNIKVLEIFYRRLYSELTKITHLSCHDSLSTIAKGNSMPEMLISPLQYSFISNFDESLSKNLLAIHYAALAETVLCLKDYFKKHIPDIKLHPDSISKLNDAYNELVKLVPDLELESKTTIENQQEED